MTALDSSNSSDSSDGSDKTIVTVVAVVPVVTVVTVLTVLTVVNSDKSHATSPHTKNYATFKKISNIFFFYIFFLKNNYALPTYLPTYLCDSSY